MGSIAPVFDSVIGQGAGGDFFNSPYWWAKPLQVVSKPLAVHEYQFIFMDDTRIHDSSHGKNAFVRGTRLLEISCPAGMILAKKMISASPCVTGGFRVLKSDWG